MLNEKLKEQINSYLLNIAPNYLYDIHLIKVALDGFILKHYVFKKPVIQVNLSPLIAYGEKELEVYIKHNYYKLTHSTINAVVAYLFKDIYSAYTIQNDDLSGRTVVRAGGTEDYTITIPILDAMQDLNFKGKTLNIRSNTDNYITVTKTEGVTINSLDALVLRRNSSSISLVYLGNQIWDVYGELP